MTESLDRRQFLTGAAAVSAATVMPPSAAFAARKRRRRRTAEMLVANGSVLTMDRRFRIAEAVALRDGKILAVGSTRDLRALKTRRTEMIDAKGHTVMPAVNDSHLHLNAYSLALPPLTIDVDKGSVAEIVAEVRKATSAAGPGTSWIRGAGYNENRLSAPPTRKDLDPVSGEHPVVLTAFDRHSVAVNSRALTIAGVTRDTAAPPGGVIEKDAAGEPTGVLRESAADLVRAKVPPFTKRQMRDGLTRGADLLHSQGVTSVTDPGIDLATLALMASMSRAGKLPLRVNALLGAGRSVDTARKILADYRRPRGLDPRLLRVAGMKVYGDGIPTLAKTAYLKQPYVDGSNGSLVLAGNGVREQAATLNTIVTLAQRAGMQVGTHATGDGTIDLVVAAYLRAMRRHRRKDPRHYVIHGDLTPPATLRTMAAHDIGVNMNAAIKYLLGRSVEAVLGPQRTDYQWPYNTALKAGVKVSSASDAPVVPADWRQGVSSAVLRRGQFGGTSGKAERISRRQALRTYTATPAWQDHAEAWKGTLQRGRAADIVVMEADLLEADVAKLTDVDVTHTLLDGKVVYERKSSKKAAAARAGRIAPVSTDRARACLEDGGCCCTISSEIMAGRV